MALSPQIIRLTLAGDRLFPGKIGYPQVVDEDLFPGDAYYIALLDSEN